MLKSELISENDALLTILEDVHLMLADEDPDSSEVQNFIEAETDKLGIELDLGEEEEEPTN